MTTRILISLFIMYLLGVLSAFMFIISYNNGDGIVQQNRIPYVWSLLSWYLIYGVLKND